MTGKFCAIKMAKFFLPRQHITLSIGQPTKSEENQASMELGIFDPDRDPFTDMQQALDYAKISKKNILVEIGGDWCKWCHILEKFITDHRELYEIRYMHYVHVRVYVAENDSNNYEFLRQLPPFDGIPHFFVYDFEGNFLHSQDTEPLEEGESYNYERVFSFLAQFAHNTPDYKLM